MREKGLKPTAKAQLSSTTVVKAKAQLSSKQKHTRRQSRSSLDTKAVNRSHESLMTVHIANQVQKINKALPSGPTKCCGPQILQVTVMLFISTHRGSANHHHNH
jgi:hypothetical protein